ncbi:MAG: prepilin-type N-terminal cleavage/methylation domain-containing protein [Gammaproteobacteria bacterium]|nr:prepilin-type N-terminal cleavage/methylation domain-containing protein [Gammaproteobacteria bacterium]NIR58694.1 prepilin-type N-terminal cleavage/methylation domain-containing protein [Gammaproteobacteria bacterium]NIR90355.1 prepilin-type N-terminal cleavage/methylation domain-containing protein [Gammaproteobacteria bacterium]
MTSGEHRTGCARRKRNGVARTRWPQAALFERARATSFRNPGFTLVELLVVLLLVALLVGIAAPVVSRSIERAKEATLKEDLFVMRKGLDDYYADHGHYPPELEALVEKRYLREIPEDPFTGSASTWTAIHDEARGSAGGIIDVLSSAEGEGDDGTPYSEW